MGERQLVVVGTADIVQLVNNRGMLVWKTTQNGQGLASGIELALFHQQPGGLWKQHHTTGQYQRPRELDREWYAIRAAVVSVLR